MGKFAKLNSDIQALADVLLEDQDLCKLIHYPHEYPLAKPDINGYNTILDKRLLLLTPKIPLAGESPETDDDGTYVMIRPYSMTPIHGGYFIVSLLVFDIYCHKDIRTIYYEDEDGELIKGDRALLIMDKIEKAIEKSNIGIGKNNLDGIEEISNRNTTFSGYALGYANIDFRVTNTRKQCNKK